MQRNIMKLSQLTNSKVLKQNTHTHTYKHFWKRSVQKIQNKGQTMM